ncbi:MAG: conjugal transfer protein TraX [Clostridia bacterium]|nr:conjugal transfer protein TraX [Clostridia bacterium]
MSSFVLKVMACIFMLIDHIGISFFPKISILRAIGRLAFPIFAFQASVGFDKTSHKEKYIIRMIIFTIISQIPFYFLRKVSLVKPAPLLNIGATLTLGLLALYCLDRIKKPWLKFISIGFIILLSIIVPMEYKWYGVLMIISFYYFRKEKYGITIFYSILVISFCYISNSTFNLPALAALIPILLYNGKKGNKSKYFFYAFYPLHMLALALIKICLN